MTDKELIQAFKECERHGVCPACPFNGDNCPIDEFSSVNLIKRLEALLTDKEKLQDYEGTGLEPQEINRVVDAYGRGMTLTAEVGQRLEIVREIPTDNLRDLAVADKDGQQVCNRTFMMFHMGADDFCSYGEPKEG